MSQRVRHDRKWLMLAACLFLASCTSDMEGFRVKRSMENLHTGETVPFEKKMLAYCVPRGDVEGQGSISNWFSTATTGQAKNIARRAALAQHATHIVWNDDETAFGSSNVIAQAYQCQ